MFRAMMVRTCGMGTWVVLVGALAAPLTHGADLNALVNPQLSGTHVKYDGWATLIGASYPGYGTIFTSSSAWPGPIASNQPGSSGDVAANKALLNKISGEGYPASSGLYLGGFAGVGGTLAVSDSHVVNDLANVVLQIQTGEAAGADFKNGILPVLTYNGGTALPPGAFKSGVIRLQQPNGTFVIPDGPDAGQESPLYTNSWMFQWDLSGIGAAVTDVRIQWSAEAHSTISALRLDQSNVFTEVVPEPGMAGMLAVAALGLMRRRR